MKGVVLVGSTATIMLHSISKLICIGKESCRQPTLGVPSRKTWRRPLMVRHSYCATVLCTSSRLHLFFKKRVPATNKGEQKVVVKISVCVR